MTRLRSKDTCRVGSRDKKSINEKPYGVESSRDGKGDKELDIKLGRESNQIISSDSRLPSAEQCVNSIGQHRRESSLAVIEITRMLVS